MYYMNVGSRRLFKRSKIDVAPVRLKPVLMEKIVHIDMKGMPPRPSYFQILFPFLKKLGATQILMEYEDMFPYEGVLSSIKNLKSYTKKDIASILHHAKQNDLKVCQLLLM